MVTAFTEVKPGMKVGGKATGLAELQRGGFAVPPGFVITGETPEQDILAAYDKLSVAYVAVRSSALNEDGAADAWAGQLETFLNVDRVNLLKRVQECMQSAQSERAQAYAEQKHITAGEVAVIVQAMVESQASGVAFSVHPVTKSTEQMVIEAGLGLGEAIVSGAITPDTYIVDTTSGAVVETLVSIQNKQLVRGPMGKTVWQAIEPVIEHAKLQPQQIIELAATVRSIAKHYGHPVDIEWAFADGTLYVLQARPITTL